MHFTVCESCFVFKKSTQIMGASEKCKENINSMNIRHHKEYILFSKKENKMKTAAISGNKLSAQKAQMQN